MNESKRSFIVYSDMEEVLEKLSDEQAGALFRAMVVYSNGIEPSFDDFALDLAFTMIRQQMDRDSDKWEDVREKRQKSGRLGGIASGKARAKQNEANEANGSLLEANEANEAVNVNVNVNDNVNVNVIDNVPDEASGGRSAPRSLSSFSAESIAYLNEKAGSTYTVTKKVREQMAVIMEAGYSLDDVKTVIDRKVEEWRDDPKMIGYLRPRTLFGDKFEEYLSQPETVQEKEAEEKQAKREKLEIDLIEAETQLTLVDEQIEEIQGKDIKENSVLYETWQDLLEHKAVLQQKIENIGKRIGG